MITKEKVIAAGGHIIVRNMPAHVYHSIPAISSTLIKGYAVNPATCRNPYIPGDEAAIGTAVHAFTFSGEQGLAEECVIMSPECLGKSKAAEKARQVYADRYPDKALVPCEYSGLPIMELLNNVRDSLYKDIAAGPILEDSGKELSLFWIDGSGMFCKARLDMWYPAAQQIWDIKTTIKFDNFFFEQKRHRYKLQGGMYMTGAEYCGLRPNSFGLIYVETKEPFRVGISTYVDRPWNLDRDGNDLGPDLMEQREEVRRLIGLIVESQTMNYWPNFPIPQWIYSFKDLTGGDRIDYW